MSESINDKHLGLLQGVINRMAGNSFLLKGWSVTLVSALLALAADRADRLLVAVALLPALTFWGLDCYFLAQERLFRRIYERVVAGDQTVPAYGLNPGKCGFGCWWASASSPTLMWFHGVVVLVVVLILAYLLTTPASGGG
jgi:hypothetical protein